MGQAYLEQILFRQCPASCQRERFILVEGHSQDQCVVQRGCHVFPK